MSETAREPRPPRVFLSRTTMGLDALAAAVVPVLQAQGYEVVHQPTFGLGWRKIRHMLVDKLRDCDAVLCLVGKAYGSAPPHELPELADPRSGRREFSYTQIEYLLARRLRKPVIAILLEDGFPFQPFDQSARELGLQQDFVQHYVRTDEHLYHSYTDERALLADLRDAKLPLSSSLLPPWSPENIPFVSIGSVFSGRASLLQGIHETLAAPGDRTERPHALVVHGMGGVGKTRLTVEYAHAHAGAYAARFFVRGSSPGSLHGALADLAGLSFLNLEEQDEPDVNVRVEAVLRWLEAQPGYLVVIDNVDSGDARRAVIELLPRFRRGHVLVTSRLHTWPGEIARMQLDVLPEDDGAALLLRYRASPKAPADSDLSDARALVRDLGGLPLAIEQAAAFLDVSAYTIAEYHRLWQRNAERVRQQHDPRRMSYPASVATTWLTSFEKLDANARSLLALLSWLAPEPVPRSILDAPGLGGDLMRGGDPRDALGRLVEFSLAKVATSDRFSVHRLIQEVTREGQTSSPRELTSALGIVDDVFDCHPDDASNWPKLLPYAPHAIAAATFGADRNVAGPTARLLSMTAVLMHAQANYKAAKPLYRRALLVERKRGAAHEPASVASTLSGLAHLLAATNQARRAEPLMRRALAIYERCFEPDHPKVALGLSNLGQLLAAGEKHEDAEPLLRRALAIDEVYFGAEHANVARDLNNLAQLLAGKGRPSDAEPLFRRALAIALQTSGEDHPNVALYLNNLGQVLATSGRAKEAEAMMRQALAVDERRLGPDHPSVARDSSNLAQLFFGFGRFADAERSMRRALEIDRRALGPKHPTVGTDVSDLGQLLASLGRASEAEPLFRSAIEIAEAAFGTTHPEVAAALRNWSRTLVELGRPEAARAACQRALEIDERRFGLDEAPVAIDLVDLAVAQQACNELTAAESTLVRALAIDERRFGPGHAAVAAELALLAAVLGEQGAAERGEPLARRALAMHLDQLSADDPTVVDDLKLLARLLEARAQQLLDSGPQSPVLTRPEVRAPLGLANESSRRTQALRRLAEAEVLLRRAHTIDENRYGPGYPSVLEDLRRIEALGALRSSAKGES